VASLFSVRGAGPGPISLGLAVDSDAFGGAEVYVRQLLRRLPPRFRCHLVVTEPVARHFADVSQRCCHVAVVPLARHRDAAPSLARRLAAHPVDLWHVNLVDPSSNRAALAAALASAPTVATLHMPGTATEVTAELRALYRELAAVIAPSAEIASCAVESLRAPAARVVRIRAGVDIPPCASPPASGRWRGTVRIGSVGRLTGQKGFDVLVAATAVLRERGVPVSVEVAGEGRERAALQAAAAGLGVRFRGFVRDVPGFLRRLDIFCLPSRREALPLALLEAMAHALPCVTTPVGDVREALGGAVRLVGVDDPAGLAAALADLATDHRAAAALGRAARQVAERDLDAGAMVASVADVLAGAAAGSGRAGARL
jgi:glycosyltransferase involved in cell wall biosynthesis